MKKFLVTTLIVVLTAPFSGVASAQWDYGQHAIDNIIESRIDARKTRARIKARKTGKGKTRVTSKTKSKKVASNRSRLISAPAKKAGVSLPSNVSFYRDTYQNFHLDDSKGYVVNFLLTSTSGKVMRRTHNFTYYNSVAKFGDIPAGKYQVVAQGVYGGKKYPVHLGSEDGTSTNPLGGNFAPSIRIEVKPGKDQWGTPTLLTLPETLHVRVIE